MRTSEMIRRPPIVRAKRQVREGLAYVWHTPELRSTLLLMAVVGTLAFNFPVVVPLLAKLSFHGNAGTYGLMSSLMGAGSLVGALAIASMRRPTPFMLVLSCTTFGIFMVAIAMAPTLAVALPLFVFAGLTSIAFMSTANTTLQLSADPSMRGRVMALYTLVFLGSTPIGGPLIGWVCQHFGPRVGYGVGGVATIAGGLVAALVLLRGRRLVEARVGPAIASVGESPEPAAA